MTYSSSALQESHYQPKTPSKDTPHTHIFSGDMATAGEILRRSLTEEVGFSKGSVSGSEELHVLAVDDSFVDRKVIERLLKISSCKGDPFFILRF